METLRFVAGDRGPRDRLAFRRQIRRRSRAVNRFFFLRLRFVFTLIERSFTLGRRFPATSSRQSRENYREPSFFTILDFDLHQPGIPRKFQNFYLRYMLNRPLGSTEVICHHGEKRPKELIAERAGRTLFGAGLRPRRTRSNRRTSRTNFDDVA
jgi:hypothetical protein